MGHLLQPFLSLQLPIPFISPDGGFPEVSGCLIVPRLWSGLESFLWCFCQICTLLQFPKRHSFLSVSEYNQK